MLKLLAFVLPLGLDSFAVAAAIGAAQVITAWQRLRISLVFVIFEGGMPLIGLGLGTALARGIGQVADYLAGAAVIAVGAWMLLAGDKDDEDKAAPRQEPGLALIALGISISLDELAIGLTLAWLTCPSSPSSWPSPCRPSSRRNSAWPSAPRSASAAATGGTGRGNRPDLLGAYLITDQLVQ